MRHYLITSLRVALLTLLLVGVVYPAVVTVFGQLLFPAKANGSLMQTAGVLRGSSLIGQAFTGPRYFHPRPSAPGYDPLNSGGSNLGPTSKALADRVTTDVRRVRKENPGLDAVPVDLVTASGSGLDPHITPAGADAQVARVAQARGMRPEDVRAVVAQITEDRQLGIFGDPRVNVLELNRALDARQGTPGR